jgi:ArsR family transcriptional regulator, arsenate/arsenite/antimonite-responsive transcriptional repressor
MRKMEKIFKALGDRSRIRILKMLEVRPLCVCEITAILGFGQSSVSRHLGILRDAGLVIDEKDGLWVNYSLVVPADEPLVSIMSGLRRWGEGDVQVAGDREAAGRVSRHRICGTSIAV